MPTLNFPSLQRTLSAPVGANLLELCEAAGLPMEAACGGFATCNTCRVRVIGGTLGPPDEVELPMLDRPDQRLACQVFVHHDAELELDPG